MKLKHFWLTLMLMLIVPPVFAGDALNSGDTTWVIVSTTLVWRFCEWIVTGKPTVLGIAAGTLILVFITQVLTGGLRVERDDEIQGLDNAIHGERGFEIAQAG